MTVRRALEHVRVGQWLPDGARHWTVIYDADRAAKIADAIENPAPTVDEPCEPEYLSSLPHGAVDGWATADEIKLALQRHAIDGTYFGARWIRERLLALGVPSELRVVTRPVQRVFPMDRAIAVLKTDPLVRKRIG